MFYLITIATGDAKIAGRAIYSYSSEQEVVANFHSQLGMAMKSDLYDSLLCMAIDEDGKVVKREKFARVDSI